MLNPDPSNKPTVPTLGLPASSAKYKRLSGGPPVRSRHETEKRFSQVQSLDFLESVTALGQAALYTPKQLERLPDSFYNKKSNLENLELTKSRLFNHPQENPHQFFKELSDKGYDHLTIALQDEKGFPFTQILNVKFPELMEQLLDLHLIIEKKEAHHKKGIGEDILIFAINAAQKATAADFYEVRWMIGKLIFLTEQNFMRTVESINLEKIDGILDWVRLQFDLEIMKIQTKLSRYVFKQEAAQIQNPKQASKTQMGIELSKIIVTELGTINAGIITPLLQLFVKDLKNPLNHDLSLVYALQLLDNRPAMRNQFLKIRAPTKGTPADLITRITLGYPNQVELTEIDARKAILSAMISRLRQAPSGSCFATCWTIELMSCQLTQCLRDFIEIMHNSKLTRKVNHQTVDFPFLITAQGKAVEAEFWVDAFGKLRTQEPYYLWEVPSFRAVCMVMNIVQPEETIKKILNDYFNDKKDADRFKPITVDEFLRLLAEWAVDNHTVPGETAISLYRKGSFAYDSQTSNPILNVWMNAIAGMSEAISSSMIKTQLITAVSGALDFLEKESTISTANRIRLSVYSKMATLLSKRIRLEYDPSIKGHPNDGAFVLYDKGSLSSSRGWVRIDNPQSFQDFIIEIIDTARQNISLTIINQHTIKILDEYITKLKNFVRSDAFLTKLIQIYDPVLGSRETALEKLLKLPFTPWITKCGNDTAKTLQVYLEKNAPPEMDKFIISSADDLLIKIIDNGKALRLLDSSYASNPGKLVCLRIPGVHAFSLMLGHPTLTAASKSQGTTAEWIKQNVVEPGKKIALTEVGPALHHAMMQHCSHFVPTKEGKEKFTKMLKHLSDKATIYSFRHRLVEYLQAVAPLEGVALTQRTLEIDTFLCQNLPSSSKYQLEKSAIHFADTNFAHEENDVHYCIIFNPCTGQLEMWEALDNGTLLSALDQKLCTHQTWEFCKNPDDILPENEKLEL